MRNLWMRSRQALLGSLVVLAAALPGMAATDTVTSLADDGSPGTLRSVLAAASLGDTIVFSVTGTITLTQGTLNIRQNLTLNGPGVANLAISGNNVAIVLTVSSGVAATISNLTIENGYSNGGTGGGISNLGTLTLNNCTVAGNYAAFGGGIYSQGPDPLILTGSTINGNSASQGWRLVLGRPTDGGEQHHHREFFCSGWRHLWLKHTSHKQQHHHR